MVMQYSTTQTHQIFFIPSSSWFSTAFCKVEMQTQSLKQVKTQHWKVNFSLLPTLALTLRSPIAGNLVVLYPNLSEKRSQYIQLSHLFCVSFCRAYAKGDENFPRSVLKDTVIRQRSHSSLQTKDPFPCDLSGVGGVPFQTTAESSASQLSSARQHNSIPSHTRLHQVKY